MTEIKKLKFGILPYGDGSGYAYDINIEEEENCVPTIKVRQYTDTEISVEIDHWPALKEAIEIGLKAFALFPPTETE